MLPEIITLMKTFQYIQGHYYQGPKLIMNFFFCLSGFVPVYNPNSFDVSYGLAEGKDLIGPFSHFTGPFGPFGFWANLLHDKK